MNAKQIILKKVEDFIIGADEQNLQKLNTVLHKDFLNVQNGFNGQKGEYSIGKEKYISLIAQKIWGGTPRKVAIESVDIVGTIAMVKATIDSKELQFISFISLINCEDGEWRVINNFPFVEIIK